MNVSLDLLSHTGTLDPQSVLDAMSEAILGALVGLGQQLLDAVLARQLDQLGLAALGEHGALPLAGGRVLVEAEWVRALLLVRSRGGSLGDDGDGGPAGEEALQGGRQRLGQLDEVGGRCRGHGD